MFKQEFSIFSAHKCTLFSNKKWTMYFLFTSKLLKMTYMMLTVIVETHIMASMTHLDHPPRITLSLNVD